jgi:hypothetical protein
LHESRDDKGGYVHVSRRVTPEPSPVSEKNEKKIAGKNPVFKKHFEKSKAKAAKGK